MAMIGARGLLGCGMALLTSLAAFAARADAIDGHWCFTDGRQFTINGPDIVTSRGFRGQGAYSRHGFSYAESGWTIAMTLVNEDTVHLQRQQGASAPPPAAPVEVWRRCLGPVSRSRGVGDAV